MTRTPESKGYSATFFVPGVPVAKGSTRAFKHSKTGAVITVQTNAAKQRPWAARVALVAAEHIAAPSRGACDVCMSFRFMRPQSHYGTGRNAGKLKKSAPREHMHSPDLDKLVRCVLDALTGVAYVDDRQVRSMASERVYATGSSPPGVKVTVLATDTGVPSV